MRWACNPGRQGRGPAQDFEKRQVTLGAGGYGEIGALELGWRGCRAGDAAERPAIPQRDSSKTQRESPRARPTPLPGAGRGEAEPARQAGSAGHPDTQRRQRADTAGGRTATRVSALTSNVLSSGNTQPAAFSNSHERPGQADAQTGSRQVATRAWGFWGDGWSQRRGQLRCTECPSRAESKLTLAAGTVTQLSDARNRRAAHLTEVRAVCVKDAVVKPSPNAAPSRSGGTSPVRASERPRTRPPRSPCALGWRGQPCTQGWGGGDRAGGGGPRAGRFQVGWERGYRANGRCWRETQSVQGAQPSAGAPRPRSTASASSRSGCREGCSRADRGKREAAQG